MRRWMSLLVIASALSAAGPAAAQSPFPPPFTGVDAITKTEGQAFSGRVAQYASQNIQCESATIAWGDGSAASAGVITQPATGPAEIAGSHTFTKPGEFTVTVTLTFNASCSGKPDASVETKATIVDAAKHPDPKATLSFEQGKPKTVDVGSFTDDDPTATPADYATATVTPGDGRAALPATVVQDGTRFVVRAELSYPSAGHVDGSWLVTETGGGDVTQAFGADVSAPPAPAPSPTPTPVAYPVIVTGADAGAGPHVKVFDLTGGLTQSYFAFTPTFNGGVRVAVGDLNGDGVDDVIAGAGTGGAPHVKVFDGRTGSLLASFFAFDPGFTGGVHVAAGDVNGDGRDDIIVGAGSASAAHVKVFSGSDLSVLRSFFAYSAGFTGGVFVGAGDVNGDGFADIVTGAGAGAAPHVKVFDGRTSALLASFFAYAGGFTGGVRVAAGDVNGDGRADVITGTGAGAAPHVKVFDGATGAELRSFFAYAPGFTGGVRVAAGDVNGDGIADIITGAGPGAAGGHVKGFSGATGAELRSFLAFAPAFTGGVFVAAGGGAVHGTGPVVRGGVLAFTSGRTLFAYHADGSLLFRTTLPRSKTGWRPVTGDWDGDGRSDVAVLGGGRLRVLDAKGKLARSFTAPSGDAAAGDFNGDGRADIAVYSPSGTASVFPNGRVAGKVNINVHKTRTELARQLTVVQDMFQGDGDGKAELVVGEGDRRGDVVLTIVDATQRRAGPRFHAGRINGRLQFSVAAGDVNGDGRQEIIAVTRTRLYVINGKTGKVTRSTRLPTLLAGSSVASAAPGADGRVKLLFGAVKGTVREAALTDRGLRVLGSIALAGAPDPPAGAQFAAAIDS